MALAPRNTKQVRNAKEYWIARGQRRCHCGRQFHWKPGTRNFATVEHLVPKSQNGTCARANLILMCEGCNSKRQDTDWIEFVMENDFPKKEWLVEQYVNAVNFFQQNNRKVNVKNLKKMLTKYDLSV